MKEGEFELISKYFKHWKKLLVKPLIPNFVCEQEEELCVRERERKRDSFFLVDTQLLIFISFLLTVIIKGIFQKFLYFMKIVKFICT